MCCISLTFCRAPKGRRERKTGSFCRKIFGFFRFSYLARWPRSRTKPSKARPISPSAAPPQLPRQEELSPGRAVRRAGVSGECAPLLPERINAFRNPPICSDFDRSARLQIRSGACLPLTREVPRRGGGREKPAVFAGKYSVFPDFQFWPGSLVHPQNIRKPALSLPQRLRRSSPVRRS